MNTRLSKIAYVMLGAILLLSGCKKKLPDEVALNTDYFAFGSYYGMCQGDCAHFYLLKKGLLYPDDMNSYPRALKFLNQPLDALQAQKVKGLQAQFPFYFQEHYYYGPSVIGCPDCHDQGGVFIEIMENGFARRWQIDPEEPTLPDEVKAYLGLMKSTLETLAQ